MYVHIGFRGPCGRRVKQLTWSGAADSSRRFQSIKSTSNMSPQEKHVGNTRLLTCLPLPNSDMSITTFKWTVPISDIPGAGDVSHYHSSRPMHAPEVHIPEEQRFGGPASWKVDLCRPDVTTNTRLLKVTPGVQSAINILETRCEMVYDSGSIHDKETTRISSSSVNGKELKLQIHTTNVFDFSLKLTIVTSVGEAEGTSTSGVKEKGKPDQIILSSSDGKDFRVSRLILSVSSSVFKDMFKQNGEHEIQQFSFPDLDSENLTALIEFLYGVPWNEIHLPKDLCKLHAASSTYQIHQLTAVLNEEQAQDNQEIQQEITGPGSRNTTPEVQSIDGSGEKQLQPQPEVAEMLNKQADDLAALLEGMTVNGGDSGEQPMKCSCQADFEERVKAEIEHLKLVAEDRTEELEVLVKELRQRAEAAEERASETEDLLTYSRMRFEAITRQADQSAEETAESAQKIELLEAEKIELEQRVVEFEKLAAHFEEVSGANVELTGKEKGESQAEAETRVMQLEQVIEKQRQQLKEAAEIQNHQIEQIRLAEKRCLAAEAHAAEVEEQLRLVIESKQKTVKEAASRVRDAEQRLQEVGKMLSGCSQEEPLQVPVEEVDGLQREIDSYWWYIVFAVGLISSITYAF